MTLELLIQALVNGLTLGFLYVIAAIGLDVIIRTTSIINFAHGQFYLIGAYVFLFVSVEGGANPVLALAATIFSVAIIAGLSYLSVFNTLQRSFKPGVPMSTRFYKSAMASIGLLMIIGQGTLLGFGSAQRGMPSIFPQMIKIANATLPLEKLLLIPSGIIILFCLYLFFYKTKFGKVLRAVSADAEASALLGITNRWYYTLGFILGCVLAGLAGAMVAPIFAVNHEMGNTVIFLACIVMTAGGIGSYRGAILGGLFVGMVLSFGYLYIGGFAHILLFILCLLLLIFKPGGLLGVPLD